MKNLIWCNDIALGGGFILSYDIHAIDTALWLLGKKPIAATGTSKIARLNANSDAHDVTSVIYQYEDGLIHDHFSQSLPNSTPNELSCRTYSPTTNTLMTYEGNAQFHRRRKKPYEAAVVDLYKAGAQRNIVDFYDSIIARRYENPTVQRAVDGCLIGILGREAAARSTRLTMEELLKENRAIEADMTGLKV